jgi:hypothetical protein
MDVVPVAARASFAATLATALLIFGAALARQAQLLAYAPGRTLLALGTGLGFVALVVGFGWWFTRLATGNTAGARWGYIGLIGAMAVMIVPLNNLRLAFVSPELNDITTDTETPPAFKALLPLRAGSENPAAYDGTRRLFYDGEELNAVEAQKRAYPDVKPVKLIEPEMVLYWRAFKAAKDMGWKVVAFEKTARTIEAYHTDFWTGNVSDIAIRVRKSGMGARLDIRSKSRMDRSDAGANAALIKAYFKTLSGQ